MVVSEYKRYLKSKFSILLFLIATIPVAVSYFFSMQDKIELQNQIALAPADLNLESTRALLDGFDGFTFLYNFLFSYDYYILFVLIILMGFGTILGTVTLSHKRTGYGNIIRSRISYHRYIKKIILAQVAYGITFLMFYFVCLITITLTIFPVNSISKSSLVLNMDKVSVSSCVSMIGLQVLLLIIFMVLVISVTSVSDVFIKNRYLIQCLPLMIYFIPLLLGSTIGNMTRQAAQFFKHIVSESYLLSIYSYFNSSQSKYQTMLDILILPFILLVAFFVLYFMNTKKYERNYLC